MRSRSLLGSPLGAVAFAVPALVAAYFASSVVDAAHDAGAVRGLALGSTGGFRALDGLLAQASLLLPLGTRALRAALVGAFFAGMMGLVLFRLATELLKRADGQGRLVPFVAFVSSTAVAASGAMLRESTTACGSVVGAVLALAPLLLSVRAAPAATDVALPLSLGLALSYEPLLGVAALASVVTLRGVEKLASKKRGSVPPPSPASSSSTLRERLAKRWPSIVAFAIGTAPFGFGLLRGVSKTPFALGSQPFSGWQGEFATVPHGPIFERVLAELGPVTLGAFVVGAAFALAFSRTRALGAALLSIVVVAVVGAFAGAPLGPARVGSIVLAGYGATVVLASVALHRIVVWVGAAQVPFAAASAVMVVMLEAAIPVRAVDDAIQALDSRAPRRTREWEELAWDSLPLGSTVLVAESGLLTRFLSARAQGSLRTDLALLPTFDLSNALVLAELTREPKLSPLVRDLFLGNAPDEWSLSSLAASRPLAVTFDPKWDRTLARHLVPSGLFARFESEPRGLVDRRQGLTAFRSERERLKRTLDKPVDRELTTQTLRLLRTRVISLAAAADRELTAEAIDDVRFFDPNDALARIVEERFAGKKSGPIVVSDLTP